SLDVLVSACVSALPIPVRFHPSPLSVLHDGNYCVRFTRTGVQDRQSFVSVHQNRHSMNPNSISDCQNLNPNRH
ncbi:hypothetical protein Ancab_003925, partial [Ancistrocladus abbreviatus]